MYDQLLSSQTGEHRNKAINKTRIPGNHLYKWLRPATLLIFSSRTGRRNAITLLLFYIVACSYACQSKQNDKPMNQQNLSPQITDSGRLFSVANLEQIDSARKVVAWFFETPQVFEFSMDSTGAQNMLSQLKEAKEKQWPVNVHSTAEKDKNRITKVTPATEAQLAGYKSNKARQEQATPVPPPKNQ